MLWARNGVWLGLVGVEKAIGGMMLGEVFGSEFLKEIFASILLQGLRGVRNQSSGVSATGSEIVYLHVMKDG